MYQQRTSIIPMLMQMVPTLVHLGYGDEGSLSKQMKNRIFKADEILCGTTQNYMIIRKFLRDMNGDYKVQTENLFLMMNSVNLCFWPYISSILI